jgi:oligogalacturonide lyase
MAASESVGKSSPILDKTWVDVATGHKVVRLSGLDGSSSSFYFHQNSFTGRGDKLVFMHASENGQRDFSSLTIPRSGDLSKGTLEKIVDTSSVTGMPVVSQKSREVFYVADHSILATNVDTHKTRIVTKFPANWDLAELSVAGLSINSDETLLAGSETAGSGAFPAKFVGRPRQERINATWAAHLASFLFVVDVKTGKLHEIVHSNDWSNHVQFSPTDPTLLMFAHEGPWEKVDRIWTVRADGSGLTNIHPRRVEGEMVGHEFWSPDGKTIWFDHLAGGVRDLTGWNLATGKEVSYLTTDAQRSVHYNISRDEKFFAADGGIYKGSTKEIMLLYPQPDGTLRTEPLCDMSLNDYIKREPNVLFTPDDKWVVFSSTQSGDTEVYAVSVIK